MAIVTYCNYIATIKFAENPVNLAPTILAVEINGVIYPANLGATLNLAVTASPSFFVLQDGTSYFVLQDGTSKFQLN